MACNREKMADALKHSRLIGLHRTPAVPTPKLTELQEIARRNMFQINNDDLNDYQEYMKGCIDGITRMDRLPDPTLPVRYPRLPGYRPPPEENVYNAWYWKTNIKGADSGKLLGKKIAIKDTIMVAGVPMMIGCSAMEGYTADTDATVVTRILDAGGVIAGKSTCENLCFSGSSFTTGKGPVLNPHDQSRSAGGSSSGNAVLVATGEVDMAVGGDQGGSIRIPAAWSGIVGLKPTMGLVPYTGAIGVDTSIDHLGPMANNVFDCALLLEAIAGYDGFDPRQQNDIKVPDYTKEIQVDRLDGIKIGLLKEGFGLPDVSVSRVDETVREAIYGLESVGAEILHVSIPLHLEGATMLNMLGCHAVVSSHKGSNTGFHGFYPSNLLTRAGMAFRSQTNYFDHTIKAAVMLGDYIESHYNGKYYAKAQNLRRLLTDAYDETFESCDVIAMPTVPFLPTKLPKEGVTAKDYLESANNMCVNVEGSNVSGHPSLSVNCGTVDGLPVGLMLMAKHYDEVMIFKVAQFIEKGHLKYTTIAA